MGKWDRTGPRWRDEIAARMGNRLYALRLAREDERIREFGQLVSGKFTVVKRHVIRPAQQLLLTALGLWGRGRRNFRDLRTVRVDLPIENLPNELEGFTILQMSDLHIDLDPSMVKVIQEKISGEKFDVCAITGDYRNYTVGPEEETLWLMDALIKSIPSPVYAILGNHDYANMAIPLEKSGARLLLNEHVEVRRGNAKILIAGIDDPSIYGTYDFEAALEGADRDADVKILLVHSPHVYAEAAAHGFDVMLCGHMHGGQVCLPGGRAVIRNDGFKCPVRTHRGLWKEGGMLGYTSAGTCGCGLPVRYNCPPEITLLRLTCRRAGGGWHRGADSGQ